MKTVVGLFEDLPDIERAVGQLESADIPVSDISVVAAKGSIPYALYRDTVLSDEHIPRDAEAGGLIGGIAGILMGMTMFAVPGIGPVAAAGWIITALAGVGIGAAAGGLVGVLVDLGIPPESARLYHEAVLRGGVLLAVRAEENNVAPVETLLRDNGARDIRERVETAAR